MKAILRSLLIVLVATGAASADDALERARAAYDPAGWPAPAARARDGLPVETLTIPGFEVRTRRLEPLDGAPVLTLGLARESVSDVEVLVQVWIEDDALAAREALLTWLSGCTQPLSRVEKDAVGEVELDAPRCASIAFARANIAAVVRFVGDGDGADLARKAARALDSEIIASPAIQADRPATRVEVTRFASERARAWLPAGEVALALDTRGDVAERAIQADRGTVEDDHGRLVFVPSAPGKARVEVFLLSTRGFRAKSALEIPSAGKP